MKTIYHFVWTLNIGGIERQVLDLCKAQLSMGWTPVVLAGRNGGSLRKAYEVCGIEIVDADLASGFDLGLKRRAYVKDRLKQADIIHIHTFNPTLAQWASTCRAKIVFTYHGNFGFGRKRTWRDKLKSWQFKRFVFKHTDYLTYNSEFSRNCANQCDGVGDRPGAIVYNGVDIDAIERFDKAPYEPLMGAMTGNFIIGVTARLAQVKRIDRLLEGFAAMSSRKNTKLLILGDGPLKQNLQDQAKQLGIIDDVIFAGHQDDVRAFQKGMDITVVPSKREAFGLVAVEALALGKPTIVFEDGGGLVEIIKPLSPEDIVPDINGLAARLDAYYDLWRTRHLERPDDIAMRKLHAQKFSLKILSNRMAEIYESL